MSRVRACRLVGLNRSSLNYQSKRPDDSTCASDCVSWRRSGGRFGYRRLGWLLAREGHVINRKKLYRIYREEKPMVRRRGGANGRSDRAHRLDCPIRSTALVTRLRIRCAQRWSPLPHFCVVDDFSRECLATVVDTSNRWRARGARTGAFGTGERAWQVIASDNGSAS